MRPYRRQMLVLVPLLGLVALVAQLAGVGTSERTRAPKREWVELVTIPGGAVVDRGSTTLQNRNVRADEGEVVRMRADVTLRATTLAKGTPAQVVCGIRYSRDGDASWTLGTPYETVVLERRGAREKVRIERSFAAPATDRYHMSAACHVAAPAEGGTITAYGTMRAQLGLPTGAAEPIA